MNAILLKHNSIRSYLLSSITSGSLRFSSFSVLLPSPKYQLSLFSPSSFYFFSIRHGHSSKPFALFANKIIPFIPKISPSYKNLLPIFYIPRCTAIIYYKPPTNNFQLYENLNLISTQNAQNLTLFYKNIFVISGIMCLSDDLRIMLSANSEKGETVREYVLTMLSKVLYYSFKTNDIKENIKNLLDVFRDIDYKKDKELYKFFDDKKEITLIQNLLTYVWAHHSFDYELLKEVAGPYISVEYYKNTKISILQFIEVLFVKNSLFNEDILSANLDFKKLKAIFINPENTPKYYSKIESKKQCGQENADFILIDESENIVRYFDTKSFMTNVIFNARNLLSVIQRSQYIISRETNNMVTGLHNLSQKLKDKPIYNKIYQIYLKAKSIQISKKKSPEDKFREIYYMLVNLYGNPEYKEIFISLAYILKETDMVFKKISLLDLKENINNEKNSIEYILKIFPKNSSVNPEEQQIVVNYFINKLFPNTFKEIKENAKQILQETLLIEL